MPAGLPDLALAAGLPRGLPEPRLWAGLPEPAGLAERDGLRRGEPEPAGDADRLLELASLSEPADSHTC